LYRDGVVSSTNCPSGRGDCRKRRRKQRLHRFTRKRDKRKDSENCSEGNKETLDAGYDEGEWITSAAEKVSASTQTTDRHCDIGRKKGATSTIKIQSKNTGGNQLDI
jgi:hypothetical protein